LYTNFLSVLSSVAETNHLSRAGAVISKVQHKIFFPLLKSVPELRNLVKNWDVSIVITSVVDLKFFVTYQNPDTILLEPEPTFPELDLTFKNYEINPFLWYRYL
jgi:hypothetical protein